MRYMRAGEVHADHLVPHVERGFVRVGGQQDPGCVHEHVETAELLDDGGDGRSHRSRQRCRGCS